MKFVDNRTRCEIGDLYFLRKVVAEAVLKVFELVNCRGETPHQVVGFLD